MGTDRQPDEPPSQDVTELLIDWGDGDREALAELMPLVYDELHRLAERFMRRERAGHTLQPTALVHEAYLRLVDQNRVRWRNRAQFYGVAAEVMRRVVLQHARAVHTRKRGGGALRITLDDGVPAAGGNAADVIAMDQALERLAALDPRQAKILELRHFGGLTVEETAACLEVSPTTVKRETRLARAWLKRELTRDPG